MYALVVVVAVAAFFRFLIRVLIAGLSAVCVYINVETENPKAHTYSSPFK